MSHKKHADRSHKGHAGVVREGKRAQFTAERPKTASGTTQILVIVIAALVGVTAYLVTSGLDDRPAALSASAGQSVIRTVSDDGGGAVSLPLSELTGKAAFYKYTTSSGRDVRFFAMKSSDGVYRAALDSCDVCFEAKKGYHQEGDDMVCNKCGNHFHSAQINEVRGGCNPVGLERTVSGDRLVIKSAELERGVEYF
ncbi:MAG TPA: DUF2318 domain-containing protein [Pyrinomonadaceae bacterium]|nr:DUF2318 domain-containing protein [Pyrinomonadaceae bacterium]